MTMPPLTDHEFMRLVRKRCENLDRSMAEIAAEFGCTPDELCRWIMAYREPKKHKPVDNTKYGPPIAAAGVPIHTNRALARQFESWRRGKDGAAATRLMHEGQGR